MNKEEFKYAIIRQAREYSAGLMTAMFRNDMPDNYGLDRCRKSLSLIASEFMTTVQIDRLNEETNVILQVSFGDIDPIGANKMDDMDLSKHWATGPVYIENMIYFETKLVLKVHRTGSSIGPDYQFILDKPEPVVCIEFDLLSFKFVDEEQLDEKLNQLRDLRRNYKNTYVDMRVETLFNDSLNKAFKRASTPDDKAKVVICGLKLSASPLTNNQPAVVTFVNHMRDYEERIF